MRRLILLSVLAALATPVAALAASANANDGTLVVRGGVGLDMRTPVVKLTVRGAIIGQLDRGRIVIDDPLAADGGGATCSGAELQRDVETATFCSGTDVRFRAVGGLYKIRIYGAGADLNVVGRGTVWFFGRAGRYSLNGNDFQPIPEIAVPLQISGG